MHKNIQSLSLENKMLNILWPIFIIVSFTYAILSGRIEEINNSVFSSTSDAVQLSINLLRYYVPMEWNYADCITD